MSSSEIEQDATPTPVQIEMLAEIIEVEHIVIPRAREVDH